MIPNFRTSEFKIDSTFTDTGEDDEVSSTPDPFSNPEKRETKPDGPEETKPDGPDEEKDSERGGPIPNPADQTRARYLHGLKG